MKHAAYLIAALPVIAFFVVNELELKAVSMSAKYEFHRLGFGAVALIAFLACGYCFWKKHTVLSLLSLTFSVTAFVMMNSTACYFR